MAGHYPGILITGHIGTNTPKFVPPCWGRPRLDPTQTGLCKFGWVWSSPTISICRVNPIQLLMNVYFGSRKLNSQQIVAIENFRHSLRGSLLKGGYNNSLHVLLAVPTPAPTPPPNPLFSSLAPQAPPSTPFTPPLHPPPPPPQPPNRNTQANALATPGANYPLVSA